MALTCAGSRGRLRSATGLAKHVWHGQRRELRNSRPLCGDAWLNSAERCSLKSNSRAGPAGRNIRSSFLATEL
jgi:hypothetical protein